MRQTEMHLNPTEWVEDGLQKILECTITFFSLVLTKSLLV